ncbi:MAG: hypothetical protein CMI54_09040 [Parcubacteria group bacterium]|nr:hypothetical protein [Parcubacteria group bacterium]
MSTSKLERRFGEFHSKNPEVYSELVRLARELKVAGRERYGIKSLFEIIRWHKAMSTIGDDFKLNNNHAPFYARLIMRKEPDLEKFFEIRAQKI